MCKFPIMKKYAIVICSVLWISEQGFMEWKAEIKDLVSYNFLLTNDQ